VRPFLLLLLVALLWSPPPAAARDATPSEVRRFQRSIVDYRRHLNPKFRKRVRKETRYIIIHTSEGGLKSTLRAVSKGKRLRGRNYRTRGGHAHYVIARDGTTYRILDKRYRADHAGRSMWNGRKNLSRISLGIELVGYHYTEITPKQYRSLSILLDILQDVYGLDDRAVLTHSQVAYGGPNRWIRKSHRGRKRCAKNFDRRKAGLDEGWSYDPDVRAGRLTADRELARIFYGGRRAEPPAPKVAAASNIISLSNTAWNIAGEDYDSPTTLYRLPSGRLIPGDRIEQRLGWNRLPRGTEVLLNQENAPELIQESVQPVKTIENGMTAWTFAGPAYRKDSTIYIFPDGRIRNGREISDWDGLPPRTRMLVGYRGPFRITAKRPPVKVAGRRYNHPDTVYLLPDRRVKTGNEIRNFRRLPRGTRVFVPTRSS